MDDGFIAVVSMAFKKKAASDFGAVSAADYESARHLARADHTVVVDASE